MTEHDLIQTAREGDSAAWQSLVHAHHEPVFRFAYLLVGDPAEADDVAQETFLRAYRAFDRFDASRPIRPWLFAIASNLAKNRFRAAARRLNALRRFSDRKAIESQGESGVEARTAAQLESERLWQAVRRLRQDDQTVIYMRYFLELPVDETAAALRVAPGTVKSRLSRALGRLRTVIDNEFPDLAVPGPKSRTDQ